MVELGIQNGLSTRRPAETNESSGDDESDQDEEDDDEEENDQQDEELVTFPPPAPVRSSRDKRPVLFSGTFPIDRPLTSSLIGPTRQRPFTRQLMVKRPRTFAIDEPIHEEQIPEVWVVAATTWFYNKHPSMSHLIPPNFFIQFVFFIETFLLFFFIFFFSFCEHFLFSKSSNRTS